MVFSSGASTMLTKSKWPRVAHCALTVAPSCSTSRLTSRMRCGLFLMVWTPSGVSVESMMYVGMLGVYRTAPLLVAGIAGASPVLERPLARCYVSADATHREPILVRAAGFSGGSLVDAEIDGRRQTPA